MHRDITKLYILLLPFLVLLAGLVLPLVTLFQFGFYEDGVYVGFKLFIEYIETPSLFNSLTNSIYVALITMVLTVGIAFVYAWGLCFTNVGHKQLMSNVLYIQLLAPSMFGAISLIYLFGKQGFLKELLMGHSIYGPIGIVMASVLFSLPHAFIIIYPILRNIDGRLYETARSLGAGPLKTLRTVTLPMSIYGIFSACTVVFIITLTDFGVAKAIGGKYNMLATEVYKQVVGQQNFNMGAIVSMVMIIPAVIAGLFEFYFTRRARANDLSAIPFVAPDNKFRDRIWRGILGILALLTLFPILTGLFMSFITYWPYKVIPTLKHYSFEDAGGFGFTPLYNSITVSIFAAVIGVMIIFSNAYMMHRLKENKMFRGILHKISLVPAAIPGTSLGIAYIFFFNDPDNILVSLYDTMWILVLVNVVHYYTVPHLSFTASFKSLNADIEDVGHSLGVSTFKTFFKVIVPTNTILIIEIMGYLFINSMTTISAVVFLYSSDTLLGSIVVVNLDDAGDTAAALAMCVLIVVVNIVAKFILGHLIEFLKKRQRSLAHS